MTVFPGLKARIAAIKKTEIILPEKQNKINNSVANEKTVIAIKQKGPVKKKKQTEKKNTEVKPVWKKQDN